MFDIFKKWASEKKEYRQMMARVEKLPEDYQYVFQKIQHYTWQFAGGDGMDMLKIHYDLIELFETSVADGKRVLEVTGEDVAAFGDELLRNAKTYTEDWREKLNRDIKNRLGKGSESK
jgi:DNA-binding ferritin-like protein (Dps family)